MSKDAYLAEDAKSRRDRLILTHLGLVKHVVGRLLTKLPGGVDQENLEAAGLLGLVEAAHRFDPHRGIKFDTFAYTRIRGAVLDELRRNCPLPQNQMEKVQKVHEAYKRLQHPVTVEMLAAAASMSVDEVNDVLASTRLTRMTSIHGVNDASDLRLASLADSPDASMEKEERMKIVREGIALLSEQERTAVSLYFLEELRQKEIGEVMNLSESRVCRLLSQALFHLREYIRKRESG